MPTRIAASAQQYLDGLRALILARPALLEEGFRVLDADVQAGTAGTIDLLGVDRSGTLTIVALAADDGDGSLLRLVDLRLWAAAEQELLSRAYSLDRPLPHPDPPSPPRIRCMLLAPGYSHRALMRLGQIAFPITPYLARPLPAGREGEFFIEPAAPIFGVAAGADPTADGTYEAAAAYGTAGTAEPPGAFNDAGLMPSLADEIPGREAGDDLAAFPEDADQPGFASYDEASPGERRDLPPDSGRQRDPYPEPLTVEELEEFERFERQRRGRVRGSS